MKGDQAIKHEKKLIKKKKNNNMRHNQRWLCLLQILLLGLTEFHTFFFFFFKEWPGQEGSKNCYKQKPQKPRVGQLYNCVKKMQFLCNKKLT